MKRSTLLGLILFVFSPVSLSAQDPHKMDLFMGYSFRTLDDCCPTSIHGWSAGIAANPSRIFGLVADFGGHYGTISGSKTNTFEYLFGPRVNWRKERTTLFGHALFGGVTAGGQNSFGMGYGGGFDLKVNERIDVRLVQFDWLIHSSGNFFPPRFGFGVVFKSKM